MKSMERQKFLFYYEQAKTLFALLLFLPFSAFSPGRARQIKEDAQGACEDCGKEVGSALIAGHNDHDKKKKKQYRDINNATARCLQCEVKYHLRHVGNARKIGLSEDENNAAVFNQFNKLNMIEQLELHDEFEIQIESVRRSQRR